MSGDALPYFKSPILQESILLLLILLVTSLAYLLGKKLFLPLLEKWVKKTKIEWDDYIFEKRIPHRILLIAPIMIVYFSANLSQFFRVPLERLSFAIGVIHIALILNQFLGVFLWFKNRKEIFKRLSIVGIVQTIQIFILVFAIIVSLGAILGKSPLVLLSSLGAVAALLTLAFRETIISFVAGLLIQFNDMFREGDWLEIQKFGVDGDLIELGMHTAKVRNWDKTIVTIPTSKLLSESVKNWRGMSETGGRRIKRSILIDQTSIQFCSEGLIDELKKIQYLKDIIGKKEIEIEAHNSEVDLSSRANGRRLTNIGLFRYYILNYLQNHPKIRKDLTLLVRQLQASPESGLPIQLYCFTNDIRWAYYEDIQADIFDHILAVLPIFKLRAFQRESSYKQV